MNQLILLFIFCSDRTREQLLCYSPQRRAAVLARSVVWSLLMSPTLEPRSALLISPKLSQVCHNFVQIIDVRYYIKLWGVAVLELASHPDHGKGPDHAPRAGPQIIELSHTITYIFLYKFNIYEKNVRMCFKLIVRNQQQKYAKK